MREWWLCLDPGITTGWCVLDTAGKIRATSVWGTAELKESLDLLVRQIFSSGHSLTVVQERMPPGRLGPLGTKLERVRRDIAAVVEDVYEIPVIHVLPGEWKTSRVAKTIKLPHRFGGAPLMIHQKDAYRMGRYVIDRERTAA